jgi:glycosyltransferase involved in cell wall biosynthesis
MSRPTLCIIHEGIGNYNAIAKIAMTDVLLALDNGWDVTCVAKRLDEELAKRVQWLPLYVPSRFYFYKWVTARRFIRKALGGRKFDVIHAHQPQVADLSDIFYCHYLSRMSWELGCKDNRPGPRGVFMRLQERGILIAEDYFYRRWNPRTQMLFDSETTRADFALLYGEPPLGEALPSPMPPMHIADEAERRAAKASYFGPDFQRPVIGFLGGSIVRKGFHRLRDAAAVEPELQFLIGGSGSEQLPASQNLKPIGLVTDLDRFYAACDVLIAPSLYEPLGLVAFEAAARGTPVIATPGVGALPHVLEHGVGASWTPGTPLMPVVQELLSRRNELPQAVERMDQALGREAYGRRLLATYQNILQAKNVQLPNASVVAAGV